MEENKTIVTEDTEEIKANDVFDAETDQAVEDASNDIYDAEEAINQKEKDLGIVRNTDENLTSGDDCSPEEEPLSENQKNVLLITSSQRKNICKTEKAQLLIFLAEIKCQTTQML